MAQLLDGAGLDLTNPLASHVESAPDLFQGVLVVDPEAESHSEHPLFPWAELPKDIADLLPTIVSR